MNENKRSNESNFYCWKLCGSIASVINVPKEEVYRQIIKETGIFEVIPIKDESVERFVKEWTSKGTGNVCEVMGKSKLFGYTNVKIYFGTSSYNSKEMNKFIEILRKRGQSVGVDVYTLEEIMNLNGR